MLGREVSQEHEDHTFLYVEVMWSESNRSELLQKFHRKSGEIYRITCTVSNGWNRGLPRQLLAVVNQHSQLSG